MFVVCQQFYTVTTLTTVYRTPYPEIMNDTQQPRLIGTLEAGILACLTLRPMHCRDMRVTLFDRANHMTNVGSIHVVLERMLGRGLVTSQWENPLMTDSRPRRIYTITDDGRDELARAVAIVTVGSDQSDERHGRRTQRGHDA
jgi:DNA-binding PadR family transcriptional regulator